jgi:hypothetical protein
MMIDVPDVYFGNVVVVSCGPPAVRRDYYVIALFSLLIYAMIVKNYQT